MRTDAEVIMIGGGPAGLASAILLAREGVQTMVLDRQSVPADKACGEGVMPPGWQFLEQMGAGDLIAADQQHPFVGIRYHSLSGAQMHADFEAGPGRGIRRTALAEALVQLAHRTPGLTIEEGELATGLRHTTDGIAVTRQQGAEVRGRMVVGADGLRSRVRRWAGLEGRATRRPRFGARQHYHCRPWSRYVEVHNGPGMEAYVTPCGPDCVGIAILWEPARCPAIDPGKKLFPSLLRNFPALQERLANSPAASAVRSTGPFEQRTKRRITDGVALLGDASGYLDPCTGEGLTLAFKQAAALAPCVASALETCPKGALPSSALAPYEQRWRKLVRSYFFCTRFMLTCQRRPVLFDRIVRLVAPRPDLLRHFLSFNMGLAPLLPEPRRVARWFFGAPPPTKTTVEGP